MLFEDFIKVMKCTYVATTFLNLCILLGCIFSSTFQFVCFFQELKDLIISPLDNIILTTPTPSVTKELAC